MKTKEKALPFTGIWNVAVHEIRVAGKWKCAKEYAPGEWVTAFMPDGRFLESFHPEGGSVRQWSFDGSTGIITVFPNLPDSSPIKCVFGGGAYLYYYDSLPHIRENARLIVEHHAHTRLKLVILN